METEPAGCALVCAQRVQCVWREKQIYFKELAHITVRVGKPKLSKVSQQAGDPGESGRWSSRLKAACWQTSFFLGGVDLCL